MDEEFKIKVGDFVIVQRQAFTKLHKVKEHGNLSLGKFTVEMDKIVGQLYCETFQMVKHPSNKKLYTLEKVTESNTPLKMSVNIEKSGTDNRNIMPDGDIQALTKNDIEKLTEEELKSNKMVNHLINNSKTFNLKTEYSQAKYIKKKEKKYFEYVEIRKPTIRLLANMYYRQDKDKILGLRIDDLSQILMYANIQVEGNHLLYDSGTCGLLTAAILNSIGSNTKGTLIHIHPGNECQKNALLAMGFPQEQKDRCLNVNIYSVLRYFYQNKDEFSDKCPGEIKDTENIEGVTNSKDLEKKEEKTTNNDNLNLTKDSLSDKNNEEEAQSSKCDEEPPNKKQKLEENQEVPTNTDNLSMEPSKTKSDDTITLEKDFKKPQWHYDNLKVCKYLENQCDSLVIATKDHPLSYVKELLQFLKGGRQLVVFHILKEPLVEVYNYLKSRLDVVMIRMSDNFLRNYQILPERTHPEVNMTSGGFILSAVKLKV